MKTETKTDVDIITKALSPDIYQNEASGGAAAADNEVQCIGDGKCITSKRKGRSLLDEEKELIKEK